MPDERRLLLEGQVAIVFLDAHHRAGVRAGVLADVLEPLQTAEPVDTHRALPPDLPRDVRGMSAFSEDGVGFVLAPC
jgi:hypothetical protein